MPKPTGPPIKNVQGLENYVTNEPSKTKKGKDRIWISVRQSRPKEWKVAASLCYVNAFDVRFEK
jgi:hypothetical protein